MAAVLGGLDALVFAGGVGQQSAPIRARAVHGLGFLGLAIDSGRNETTRGDLELTADGAPSRTLVMEVREDRGIARQTRAVLAWP